MITAVAMTTTLDDKPRGILEVLPDQGSWPEAMYLAMPGNHLIEYTDGNIEVLPMPTTSHQEIVLYLLLVLRAVTQSSHPGRALMAPLKLRIRRGKYREPDVMVALRDHAASIGEQFWTGADLVVEVVSPDDEARDHEEKPLDYAEGRVPEYWIVDPQQQTFTVLALRGEAYAEHGVFRPGETATSALLNGVTVDVAACFAAGRPV